MSEPGDEAAAEPYRRKVGARIRAAREQHGWSQADFGKRVERTQTAVSYWENGQRAIDIDDLAAVAKALEIPAWDLLPDEAVADPPPYRYFVSFVYTNGGRTLAHGNNMIDLGAPIREVADIREIERRIAEGPNTQADESVLVLSWQLVSPSALP